MENELFLVDELQAFENMQQLNEIDLRSNPFSDHIVLEHLKWVLAKTPEVLEINPEITREMLDETQKPATSPFTRALMDEDEYQKYMSGYLFKTEDKTEKLEGVG